jgi:hypothetical protein
VENLQNELGRQRERDSKNQQSLLALQQAIESVHADASGDIARTLTEPPRAGNGTAAWQEELVAAQRQFERERAVLQSTVEKLREETARLRQALEIVGVYNE